MCWTLDQAFRVGFVKSLQQFSEVGAIATSPHYMLHIEKMRCEVRADSFFKKCLDL